MSSIFETKVESETLTSDELASITGCPRRHDQIVWLKSNGWVYHLKRNGEPVIGRLYARLKLAGVNPKDFAPAAPWTPDFSKLS
ncbi:DUF4224 domain-containing protein [Undibacterium sp. TC4M20W]|uniref:DUF4224 domain-containing protein n=1 Tax=Undibacterium sp. TC4M20W TaxID=3413052 RepID=UPI003BF2D3C1